MKRYLNGKSSAWHSMLAVCLALLLAAACLPLHCAVAADNLDAGLSPDEQAYMAAHPTLRLAVGDGAAPIASVGEDGSYSGIVKSVTTRIEQMLGVRFVIVPCRSTGEVAQVVQSEEVDMVMIPSVYAQSLFPQVPLSDPFLTAGTILFYHDSLQPNQLSGKTCAVVKGGEAPAGVAAENILHCETRLETLEKVENGLADYGYGNEFSLAYYIGLKGFQHIATVPIRTEIRRYCYGVVNQEPLLLSALNKAVAQLDAQEMQTIILEASVLPEQPITWDELFHQFEAHIFGAVGTLLLGLAAIIIYIYRTNRELRLQNLRLSTIAEVSGDLLFEYNIKTDQLLLSRQFKAQFDIEEQSLPCGKSAIAHLVDIDEVVRRRLTGEELVLPGGRYYKAVYSYIQSQGPMPLYLVGKLTDISVQRAKLEALANQAKLDGLTHLVNGAECRRLAEKLIQSLPAGRVDALLIVDVDQFKSINDTYGHYTGDQVLIKTAAVLQGCFRSSDVVGRLGGDEFMVYIKDVDRPALDKKCGQVVSQLHLPISEESPDGKMTVSLGAYMIHQPEPFTSAYQQADKALYEAKARGKNQYVILE